MDAFKAYVTRSASIVAAHAMLRALADRRALGRHKDLVAYVNAVCGERDEAKRIAQRGMDIILEARGRNLSKLSDKDATTYIRWLGDFVVRRATDSRMAKKDRGRTLLSELRKTMIT